jgi:hypothetical protein
VRLTSLGHPPVFVVRADGRVESFEKGGPAGVVDDEVYEEEELDLRPGDLLVQYPTGRARPATARRCSEGRRRRRGVAVRVIERGRRHERALRGRL